MKRLVFHLVLILCITQSVNAQLTSLGVIEDSLMVAEHYKILFSNNRLYASSSDGVYQYDLSGSGSEWEKLSFTNSTILEFDVRGDTIVALSKQLLYISTDGGKTADRISVDAIDPDWNKDGLMRTLKGLALHPSDAKRIHVSQDYGGLSYTDDGGLSWVVVDSILYSPYLRYNPLDERYLIGYGTGHVIVSRDGGFQWTKKSIRGNVVHDIAFHPTNKWRIVACGSLYAMSDDGGYNWRMIGTQSPMPDSDPIPPVYLFDVVYDSRDPKILYGADEREYSHNRIPIMRSTDGGFTWEKFYVIETSEPTGVFNICMKDNLLIIYTLWDKQVFLLDVDAVDTSISTVENTPHAVNIHYDLLGRPVANPTRGIYIKDGKKVAIE